MNRRSFVKLATSVLASAVAFAKLPLENYSQPIREMAATKYLQEVYKKWKATEHNPSDSRPIYMVATPDLHDTFWREQEQRSMWAPKGQGGMRIELFRLPESRYRFIENKNTWMGMKKELTTSKRWWADVYQGYFPVY